MKRKIIGNVEPKCEYCVHGKLTPDKNNILCEKKGVLDKDDYCKKFIYDALKRVPVSALPVQKFSKEDFEL